MHEKRYRFPAHAGNHRIGMFELTDMLANVLLGGLEKLGDLQLR
jgi:hypothetical protein